MGKHSLIRELDLQSSKSIIPQIKTWYTVKVTQKIKEWEQERTQVFEGLVIKTKWKGWINSTITLRKICSWIWVEKVFPLHGSNIVDIQILKIAKVRRSKLYYMRERFGKSARLQERQTTPTQRKEMIIKIKDEVKEEVKVENKEEVEAK